MGRGWRENARKNERIKPNIKEERGCWIEKKLETRRRRKGGKKKRRGEKEGQMSGKKKHALVRRANESKRRRITRTEEEIRGRMKTCSSLEIRALADSGKREIRIGSVVKREIVGDGGRTLSTIKVAQMRDIKQPQETYNAKARKDTQRKRKEGEEEGR